jgi:F-type H+/Na+-transporting ATPase subunit alpha
MKALSKTLRLDYLQYKELLQMTQLRTTGLSKEAEKRLKRGEAINQLIIQDKNNPVPLEQQIIYLYALNKGILDSLSTGQIRRFKEEIPRYVNANFPEYVSLVRETKELGEAAKEKLESALKGHIEELIK